MATDPRGHYVIMEGVYMTSAQAQKYSDIKNQIEGLNGSIETLRHQQAIQQGYLNSALQQYNYTKGYLDTALANGGKVVLNAGRTTFYVDELKSQLASRQATVDSYKAKVAAFDAQIAPKQQQIAALEQQKPILLEQIKEEQKELTIKYYTDKDKPVPASAIPAPKPAPTTEPTPGPKPPAAQPPTSPQPTTAPLPEPISDQPSSPAEQSFIDKYGALLAFIAAVIVMVIIAWRLTKK